METENVKKLKFVSLSEIMTIKPNNSNGIKRFMKSPEKYEKLSIKIFQILRNTNLVEIL